MLHELFHAAACLHGKKNAVIGNDTRLTYEQLEAEALRLAEQLGELGVQAGDRVAVLLPNSAETAVTIWAVLARGGVLVPLHAAARTNELHVALEDSDPSCLVTSVELSRVTTALLAGRPQMRAVVEWARGTTERSDETPGRVQWRLAHEGTAVRSSARAHQSQADELAALLYTSGTTGRPKGVMLSHRNMVAALRAVNAYLALESTDVLYSALPLSSSYGLYQLLLGLAVGGTVVLDRSFAFPVRSLARVVQERATVFAGVPTMYAWIVNSPALGQFDLRHLRMLTSAAAALPSAHARELRTRLPGARLFVMYGQTECKRITYLDPADLERKPGSVGHGMPYQQHAVVDDSGEPIAPGDVGELVVSGPHVMHGYWRDPAGTAQKLRPISGATGSWLHTGDLFRVDEEGYLYFVGRRDDILKIGGHKVSPSDVEDVLFQMPEILEAAVVGIPDELWGQATRAHVVLREGATCDEAAVTLFCKARLRAFMVPKSVVFEKRLPKTESGKVKKRELA